jgi:hypothetical protein
VTFREILAEFAQHRQGVDTQYEVHLFQRLSPRGEALDGFDIEDPQAMAAERERLEKMRRPRLVPAPKIQRVPRVTPCEQCGADVLENIHGGNVARFCSDSCRSAAHLATLRAQKKCRLAACGHDAAEGKTYCRPHLDAVAARERARRQQRSSEARKAA